MTAAWGAARWRAAAATFVAGLCATKSPARTCADGDRRNPHCDGAAPAPGRRCDCAGPRPNVRRDDDGLFQSWLLH